MNAGATTGRVHEALKLQIMERELRPGDRLDPAQLSERFASSITPVREALHLMSGEGLVEARSGSGFHVPHLDEPGLKDLYAWSADLIGLCVGAWPRAFPAPEPRPDGGTRSAADAIAAIFLHIAAQSTNREHYQAVAMLNLRLHAVRTVEPQVIRESGADLPAWTQAVRSQSRDAVRRLNGAYHRQRIRVAAEIVRAVYRAN